MRLVRESGVSCDRFSFRHSRERFSSIVVLVSSFLSVKSLEAVERRKGSLWSNFHLGGGREKNVF